MKWMIILVMIIGLTGWLLTSFVYSAFENALDNSISTVTKNDSELQRIYESGKTAENLKSDLEDANAFSGSKRTLDVTVYFGIPATIVLVGIAKLTGRI